MLTSVLRLPGVRVKHRYYEVQGVCGDGQGWGGCAGSASEADHQRGRQRGACSENPAAIHALGSADAAGDRPPVFAAIVCHWFRNNKACESLDAQRLQDNLGSDLL